MRTSKYLFATAVIVASLIPAELYAQRGGGARGGGGAARAGGGAAAARSAGGSAFDRSPSMSRSAPPQVQRPAQPAAAASQLQRPAQPAAATRPANNLANRPNVAGGNVAGGAQLGGAANVNAGQRTPLQSAQGAPRPSQNQVSSFLNLPQQSTPAPPRPSQLPASGSGSGNSKTVTTPGGSTITVAGGKGSVTTGGGTTVGGAAGGIKVEGANGNTYVKGKGVAGATDGTNSAIRGGSVTGIQGAGGNSAVNVRGGYADSAGNRAAGGATAIQGKNGYTAVNVRGGSASGGAARAGSVTAIRGPGGTTIAYGRGASFVNGQFVGGAAWRGVNANFTHWNYFRPGWYARYPGCWWPGKWAIATSAWATVTWAVAGSYCGCTSDPIYYDYSQNVTYDQGTVYYGDQPVATAQQYFDEALHLADNGQNTTDEQWLPLGVFAVVAEGQTATDKLVQLAVNKDGVIRGNYQDLLSDKITPIIGSVDKETQRVAMKIEGNNLLVAETGLYNLTNDEVPVLLQFGPDQQENRTLIRLNEEEAEGAAK